jgi:hypothetical protein
MVLLGLGVSREPSLKKIENVSKFAILLPLKSDFSKYYLLMLLKYMPIYSSK